jgi:hypothetical protein
MYIFVTMQHFILKTRPVVGDGAVDSSKRYTFCTCVRQCPEFIIHTKRQIDKSTPALDERNVILPRRPPNTMLMPRTAQVPGRRSGGSQSMLPVADDTQFPVRSSEKGCRLEIVGAAFKENTVSTLFVPRLRHELLGLNDSSLYHPYSIARMVSFSSVRLIRLTVCWLTALD